MKKIILFCSLLFISIFAFASMIAPDQGLTPLMNACRSGDLPQVKKLIKEGADVNATSKYYHRTALMYAVNGSINGASIVDYLLKNGAKLEITDTSFNTALLCCLSNYPRNHYGKSAKLIVNSRRKAAWLLLKAGAKVKVCNNQGKTPLLAASDWLKPDFIAELLKRGANIEARSEYSGNTALINALAANNIKVVELLLKNGADPNARNYHNNIPMFFSKSPETVKLLLAKEVKPKINLFMVNWARWGDLNLIKIAIKENFPVTDKILINAAKNSSNPEVFPFLLKHYPADKKPPLDELLNNMVEFKYKDTSGIKMLLEKGANPNKANKWGRTPLSIACHRKNLKVVELLLKHGADLNTADKQGKTPLMWLMWRSGPVEIGKILIAHGAKIDIKDKQGRSALLTLMASSQYCNDKALPLLELLIKHKADLNLKDKNDASALLLALGHQQSPVLIKYLLKHNAKVNTASKNNVSPLMLAARHYDAEIVKLLLERGAKVNATDDTGWTPLMYAAEYWPVSYGCAISPTPRRRSRKAPQKTIRLLLQHGANPEITDKYGNTPLIEAARWADSGTLKLLLKYGGNDFVNARDKRGRSALMRALRDNPDEEAIKALIAAGAKCEIAMNYEGFESRNNMKIQDGLVSSRKNRSIAPNEIAPPLFRAVLMGKKDIIKAMLEHGADPNWQYQRRKEERPIFPMAYCRDPEIAALLIKAGAKKTSRNNSQNINPLNSINYQKFWEACRSENLVVLEKMLKTLKLQNTEKRKQMLKNNIRSLKSQNTEIQEQLLSQGLRCAIISNNLKVVKWLLKQGARLSKDSIMSVVKNAEHPDVLRYLLKHGLNTEYRDGYWDQDHYRGKSAIHFAASAEIVDILVKNGMNVNDRDSRHSRGEVPLQSVVKRRWKYKNLLRRSKIIEALIKNGAKLEETDKNGSTVLFSAFYTRHGNTDINLIKTLLKYGANVNAKNSKGDTLLNLAIRKNNCYLTDILLAAGADPSQVKKEDINKARPYIRRQINKALLKQKEKNIAKK